MLDSVAGFRKTGSSGLLVPLMLERIRETWPRDEWKALDRVAKHLHSRSIKFSLRCNKPDCSGLIQRLDGPDPILRCDCTDRVLQVAF